MLKLTRASSKGVSEISRKTIFGEACMCLLLVEIT